VSGKTFEGVTFSFWHNVGLEDGLKQILLRDVIIHPQGRGNGIDVDRMVAILIIQLSTVCVNSVRDSLVKNKNGLQFIESVFFKHADDARERNAMSENCVDY